MQQLYKVLCEVEDLDSFIPAPVGESGEWAAIVSSAEDNHESFCKALRGKPLFSARYGTYTVTLNELKNVLKASSQAGQQKQADGIEPRGWLQGGPKPEASLHRRGMPALQRKHLYHLQPCRYRPKISSPLSGQPAWTLMLMPQLSPTQKRQQLQLQENRVGRTQ
jgi:hypothetical protein